MTRVCLSTKMVSSEREGVSQMRGGLSTQRVLINQDSVFWMRVCPSTQRVFFSRDGVFWTRLCLSIVRVSFCQDGVFWTRQCLLTECVFQPKWCLLNEKLSLDRRCLSVETCLLNNTVSLDRDGVSQPRRCLFNERLSLSEDGVSQIVSLLMSSSKIDFFSYKVSFVRESRHLIKLNTYNRSPTVLFVLQVLPSIPTTMIQHINLTSHLWPSTAKHRQKKATIIFPYLWKHILKAHGWVVTQ